MRKFEIFARLDESNSLIFARSYNFVVPIIHLNRLDSAHFVQVKIPSQSPVVGQRVSEISLPEGCLIVSLRRGRRLHVAHGYTVLQGGDRVTVFATQDCIPIIRQRLAGDSAGDEKSEQRRVRHREFTIPAGASCSAKMVRELTLPSDCILVSISREDEPIIPHGNTVLQAGDVVELFGAEDELSEAELCLSR